MKRALNHGYSNAIVLVNVNTPVRVHDSLSADVKWLHGAHIQMCSLNLFSACDTGCQGGTGFAPRLMLSSFIFHPFFIFMNVTARLFPNLQASPDLSTDPSFST